MTGHRLDLSAESTAVGTFFKTGSANLVEALGYTALDFLLVDKQHASPSLSTVEEIIRAADLNGLATLVRLPDRDPTVVNNLLDAGADGLVIPQVEQTETVEAIRDAARYDRSRSFAMSTRAGRFGNRSKEEYLQWVENELTLIAQIESKAGIDAAEDIGAVEGLGGLMVGPADLAQSLDVEMGAEQHEEHIARVFEAAATAGCSAGMYVGSESALERERERAGFLLYNSDIGLVTGGIQQVLE